MEACMTMAASKHAASGGQSVLEFLLLLPLMMALIMLMIRVNLVIQEGIVDQQWARAQALFVSANGAVYPRRPLIIQDLAGLNYNQFVVGVSDTFIKSTDAEGDGGGRATASVYDISGGKLAGSDQNTEEPAQRSKVRVRNTVTLCTPVITVGGAPVRRTLNGVLASYNMPENPKSYASCSSPLGYITNEQ